MLYRETRLNTLKAKIQKSNKNIQCSKRAVENTTLTIKDAAVSDREIISKTKPYEISTGIKSQGVQ